MGRKHDSSIFSLFSYYWPIVLKFELLKAAPFFDFGKSEKKARLQLSFNVTKLLNLNLFLEQMIQLSRNSVNLPTKIIIKAISSFFLPIKLSIRNM